MPTNESNLTTLTKLGNKNAKPEKILEVFPNHAPGKITVTLNCKEFTSLAPSTNLPDYAQIDIVYVPDKFVVESKSVKLYLETYRNIGVFYEHLVIDIANDFIKYVKPHSVDVTAHFNVRGGIAICANYNWKKE